jgi:hypothetical protein
MRVNDLMLRPPASGVARNPLVGMRGDDMHAVAVGASLLELAEAVGEGNDEVLICRLNGEFISRLTAEEHETLDELLRAGKEVEAEAYEALCVRVSQGWRNVRVTEGDVVEWHPLSMSGNTLRSVLLVAVIVFMWWNPIGWTAAGVAAFGAGASLAINILLPPKVPSGNQGTAAGSVYTTSLQGNQARLNQPIWKVCGRRKIAPPFASMPYQRWINAGTDVDNKQYYYGLFAVTAGVCNIESALIGGTPISHFQDVIVSTVLGPGVTPSQAKANVETSTVVSANTLDTGRYVGGFAACKPQRSCTKIEVDISASRGITQAMTWRVEVRPLNDFGVPTGAWVVLANETRTGSTSTPQQWTYAYTLTAGPYRPEVRIVRTDVKNTAAAALHELAWIALRGILAQAATLDAQTTHYEVVLRASAQLSQYSQRDITLIVQGRCRTWAAGVWGPEIYTRNPAWWALDCASTPPSGTWGLGEPDSRIDIQSFADLAAICDARQDHFDYCFDTAVPAWDALQLIARSCRARVFRRNGILSIARDDLQTLPVTAFSSRNTVPDSMTISERLPTREQPDGVTIEYEDARTWQWTPVDCPCPGVVTMANPVRKRIEGIVGATHALREGLYEAAALLYRTRTVSLKTEMEGVLPAYMAPISFQPDIVGYGSTGDVVAVDATGAILTLSEPPVWGAADLYIRLRRDDGTLTAQTKITPGPGSNDVVLPAAPDFTLVLNDGSRERPIYVVGPLVGGDELVKVISILDGGVGKEGEQLYDLNGIIDDPRVHAADNAYLPGLGVVQDPLDTLQDTGGSGLISLAQINAHTIVDGVYNGATGVSASVTFKNDGTLTWTTTGTGSGSFSGEWNIVPISALQAGTADVRFTLQPSQLVTGIGNYGHVSGSALSAGSAATGTRLGLGTNRTISVDNTLPSDGSAVIAQVLCEVFDTASSVLQGSGVLTLVVWATPETL